MLLRPVVLLLLCATAGMCATLAFYPTPDNEDGSPAAVDAAAAAASDSTDAAGKASAGDSPAAEEPKANSLVGENLIDGTLAGSKPAADKPEVDVSVADGAVAKKLQTDVDGPAGDTPALKDAAAGKHATHMAPSSSSSPVDEGNDIKPVQNIQKRPKPQEESSWSINSIRSSFQSAHSYFNSLVELVGGPNGVCQYRCKYGEHPKPRPGYQLSEPDGCSTSLMGFQLDLGIPAMTRCCNLLDTCYETCGTTKQDCDSEFRTCLRGICSDVNKSLGFESKVQACSSMADTLHSMVQTLGCRPYMNSQRAACFCEGEEKDEL